MLMRFRGGGVGHTSTRSATDRFLQDRDRLDQDSRTQGDGDESEGGFEDADDVDEAQGSETVDKSGDSDPEPFHGSHGGDNLGRGDGEGLGGSDEEPGNGDVDDDRSGDEEPGTGDVDNDRSGDEEPGTGDNDDDDDYGYRYLVDDGDDEDSDDPLDFADDALGPEDGEGDVDEINLLGFAAF